MLSLPAAVFSAVRSHSEETFPNECCGVLIGRTDAEMKKVTSVHPIENRFEPGERYHRFLITPDDYRNAESDAKHLGLDILGFYHSHPDAPSVASKYDLDHAFPWFSYLILSVMARSYRDHHSWVMENDRSRFKEEEVIIE